MAIYNMFPRDVSSDKNIMNVYDTMNTTGQRPGTLDFSNLAKYANNSIGLNGLMFGTKLGQTGKATEHKSQIYDLDMYMATRPGFAHETDEAEAYRCFSDLLLIAVSLCGRLIVPKLFVYMTEVKDHSAVTKTRVILPPRKPAAETNEKKASYTTITTSTTTRVSEFLTVAGQTPEMDVEHQWNRQYTNAAFEQLIQAVAVLNVVEMTLSNRIVHIIIESSLDHCSNHLQFANLFLQINSAADIKKHDLFVPVKDHYRKAGFPGPRDPWDSVLVPSAMAMSMSMGVKDMGQLTGNPRSAADERAANRIEQFRHVYPHEQTIVDTVFENMQGYTNVAKEDDWTLPQPLPAYVNLAGRPTYAHPRPPMESSTRFTCIANVTRPNLGEELIVNVFGVNVRIPTDEIWEQVNYDYMQTACIMLSVCARTGHILLGNTKNPAMRASQVPLLTLQRTLHVLKTSTGHSHRIKYTMTKGATALIAHSSLIPREVGEVSVIPIEQPFKMAPKRPKNLMYVEIKVIGAGDISSAYGQLYFFHEFTNIKSLANTYQEHLRHTRKDILRQKVNRDVVAHQYARTKGLIPTRVWGEDLADPTDCSNQPGLPVWRAAQAAHIWACANKQENAVGVKRMREMIVSPDSPPVDINYLWLVKQVDQRTSLRLEPEMVNFVRAMSGHLPDDRGSGRFDPLLAFMNPEDRAESDKRIKAKTRANRKKDDAIISALKAAKATAAQ